MEKDNVFPLLWVPERYLNQPSNFLKVPEPGPQVDQAQEDQDDDGPLWVVNVHKSEDLWLEVNDGEGWYSAIVKWDGCIHLSRYHNYPWGEGPEGSDADNEDYIHICDIDDMIERLQALKKVALQYFEGNWPG